MKVYIAMSCPNGDLWGLQTFSSFEKSEAYCKVKNEDGYFSGSAEWYTTEYELDVEKKDE